MYRKELTKRETTLAKTPGLVLDGQALVNKFPFKALKVLGMLVNPGTPAVWKRRLSAKP